MPAINHARTRREIDVSLARYNFAGDVYKSFELPETSCYKTLLVHFESPRQIYVYLLWR